MKKEKTINQETKVEIGDFGPIYRQFERKPKEAIESFLFLLNMEIWQNPKTQIKSFLKEIILKSLYLRKHIKTIGL